MELIDAAAAVGVRHVGVEHLKLPIERSWAGTSTMSAVLGTDILQYFSIKGAKRVGREWILPLECRLERILELRERSHMHGLSFGAADNDLLLLSDGGCCCSGADLIAGFTDYFTFNYTSAVRSGLVNGQIRRSSLNRLWKPEGSVSRFVNSRSRLHSAEGPGVGISAYIDRNWNGSPNGSSPTAFYGVEDTGERDEEGFKVYTVEDRVMQMYQAASSEVYQV